MLSTQSLPTITTSEESDEKMTMDECSDDQQNSSDESLTPLAKMKKYAESDNIFDRQTIVRSVLETMRSVVDSPDDTDVVLGILWKLSDDMEPSVRAELMEQIPHIALLCHEYGGRLLNTAFQFLLPVVVNYLQDPNNQVRKTSQAALLMMLEQDLVNKGIVEDQVCPIILRLSDKENFDDFRTEAVALMSKMAPLIGREVTERLFLKTFANLCVDGLYHVRKVCAANFGDFCTVMGIEATEKVLLSRFSYLCEDGVWNVRKACADVFTTVSYNCTLETRHNQLTSLFVNLLCDQSRWVRLAAFQALGPFISTFADPTQTGLYFNEDGMHIIRDNSFYENDEKNEDESVEKDDALQSTEDPANYAREICDRDDEITDKSESKSVTSFETFAEFSDFGTADVCDTPENVEISEKVKREDDDDDENIVEESQCSNKTELVSPMQSIPRGESDNYESIDTQSASDNNNESDPPVVEGESSDNHAQLTVSGSSPGHLHVHLDESAFNSFRYWRIPIPDLELDIDIVEGKPTKVNVKAKVHDDKYGRLYSSELNLSLSQSGQETRYVDSPRPLSYTRIRTASVGMIQDESGDCGAQKVVSTNSKEAVVTSVNGVVTNVKQSYSGIQSAFGDDNQDESGDYNAQNTNSDTNDTFVKNNARQRVQQNWASDVRQKSLTGVESFFDALSVEINARRRFDTYPAGNNSCHAQKTNDNREIKSRIVKQTIVPNELLEHYVSMSDLSLAETVDNEIARYCAYSLPAVAMTLGRKNWPILKQLYEALASDMQWKVRRTIASSIHEVALILGEDLANKDLIPIFNGFIKDLDEVRIGILHHIADFFKFLNPEERRDYLPKLCQFLKTDNECNWRFRLELTEQLAMLASLYQPTDIREYLMPIGILLISDKVAEVRQVAVKIVGTLVREVSSVSDPSLVKSFLAELAEQFAHHKKWTRRQTFVSLCNHLVNENSLSLQQFAHDLLPHLLDLSYDAVPNVRLSVAKTLSQTIIPLDYYSSHHNPYHEMLIEVLRRLQTDHDRDVRYYANLAPQNSALSASMQASPQLVLPV